MIKYCKFLWHQLKGWQTPMYCLWCFGFGIEIMVLFSHPITWVSIVSFLSTLAGMACVVAISACSQLNGWLGILSALGYITIAIVSHHYLNVAIQVGYVCSLDIPVLLNKNWNKGVAKKIRHLSFKGWGLTIIGALLVWLAASQIMIRVPGESLPIIDSLTFAISFVSGILCTCRYSEQYFGWIMGSIIEITLWFLTPGAGVALAMAYIVYLLNDVIGFTISPWFSKKNRSKAIAKGK